MADEQSNGAVVLRQVSGGTPEILHIRGKVTVGELAARGAKPRKVKAQHGYSASRELGRDPLRGEEVLRAGEAMGEDGVGPNRPGRKVEPGGERITAAARERNALNESHASVLRRSPGHERISRKHSTCPATPAGLFSALYMARSESIASTPPTAMR